VAHARDAPRELLRVALGLALVGGLRAEVSERTSVAGLEAAEPLGGLAEGLVGQRR